MGKYDEMDSDETFIEAQEEEIAEESSDAEPMEELHFEDERIRGYEDVLTDLDEISKEDKDEIAEEADEEIE